MNLEKAKKFVTCNARPLDEMVYRYYFEHGTKQDVLNELCKFQNIDGGFGHALEPDNWNPNSNPIAVNDAIITIFKIDAFEEAQDIIEGVLSYLRSHDSFDESSKQWHFGIESNKNYPHAIWWENDGNGENLYNPTVSLAAVLLCFGGDDSYRNIIKEAFEYLETKNVSGDALKCFILCYKLLKKSGIYDIIDLCAAKELIIRRLKEEICTDITKYGIEYVTLPSDFFDSKDTEFVDANIQTLIDAEKSILGNIQKEDGGFDICWQWYTPYTEFEQARKWWRPRITINKMMFYCNH